MRILFWQKYKVFPESRSPQGVFLRENLVLTTFGLSDSLFIYSVDPLSGSSFELSVKGIVTDPPPTFSFRKPLKNRPPSTPTFSFFSGQSVESPAAS